VFETLNALHRHVLLPLNGSQEGSRKEAGRKQEGSRKAG